MKENLAKVKYKILLNGKGNTKIAKNNTETWYLSLQPVSQNVKKENLCRFSTKDCRRACLQFTGMNVFSNAVNSRQRKTDLFVSDKKNFISLLARELETLNNKGKKIAVRLNTLSDVNWELEFKKVGYDLSIYKNLLIYDYTKDHNKVIFNTLSNYHLTLSYSGYNWKHCEYVLNKKLANVAVVFKKELPLNWRGFKVIDGTNTDERFLDKKGVIVGLKYKTPRGVKYEKNKFIVDE